MFMQPLREKSQRGRVAKPATLLAPVKGWYVSEGLAAAPKGTAYLLENAFPETDSVRVRGGAQSFATGMGSSTEIESLLVYSAGGTDKLFACGGGSIWNITAGGAVGAADVTGLSNDRWEAVNMTTSGGSFLFALNGADDGRLYDGTSWTTTSVTGISEALCTAPWSYKNRIYFIEANTSSIWYLGTDAIGGSATEFPLGGVFPMGGTVVAGATWSVDSGSGQDDKIVFLSSEGEVAVYEGSNPGDATTWQLIGVYYVGRPVGAPRCVQKFGGDLGILTELGIVPLSKAVSLDRAALSDASITKPIAPEFRRAVTDRRTLAGWQMSSIPYKQMFVLALPKLATDEATQFVANMVSGAWCRFTGWDAASFANFEGNLYWGGKNGVVYQGDITGSDDGTPYLVTVFPHFSDLGSPALYKHMRMARANVQASFNPTQQFTIRTDYDFTTPPGPTTSAAPSVDAVWDTAVWDITSWPSVTTVPIRQWRSVSGIGTMVSPVWQITLGTTQELDLRMTSIDVLFEVGEVLG